MDNSAKGALLISSVVGGLVGVTAFSTLVGWMKDARGGLNKPWIRRQGKLGGPGYASRPARERQALLRAAVAKFGYRSTLGSILALERARRISSDVRGALVLDRRWLVQNYGGEGAFTQRSKRKAA